MVLRSLCFRGDVFDPPPILAVKHVIFKEHPVSGGGRVSGSRFNGRDG